MGGTDVRFDLSDPDGEIEVGAGSGGFAWTIQTRTSEGASWAQYTHANNGELFAIYSPQEEHVGRQVRAIVSSYEDRRGTGKSAESEATAKVTADPIANAPPRIVHQDNITVTEGSTNLNVGNPLTATDRDGDTVTFALGTGDDSALFELNASTRQLRSKEALDFETTDSGLLFVTITLSDGKGVDSNNLEIADTSVDVETTVTIAVVDVEEEGVVTLSAEEPEVGEDLEATLADGDGSVSGEDWQWGRSEDGRTNWISISGAESSSYTPTEDDEDFYLRARVEYTDNRGTGKSAEGVTTGPVPSENRRPRFPDAEEGERTVQENTRAGTNIGAPVAAVDPESNRLTYTLTGTDAAAFTIVATTGQIRVKDALDFETKDSYSVTVNVHDGRDGAGATSTDIDNTQDVTITVENVDEPGTVTLSSVTETIQARVEVTAVLSDDDVATGVTWQWSHSPNGRTDWANISGATDSAYTPLDDHEGRFIRATASYTDGHRSNKTAHGVSPRRVEEPPPVNSAPAFPSTENGQRDVPEDASSGDTIGAPVAATDLNAGNADVNDPLAYSLTGTDADTFTIDAGTGQLALAQNVELDFEGTRSYRVTVEVTDGYDRLGDDEDPDVIDDTISVTINVTNVNEAPTVSGEMAASFTENDSSAIATYTGSDPERDTLTWSVLGADADSFAMTDRGRLHFASPPSFEGGKTTYEVTVVATDEGEPDRNG